MRWAGGKVGGFSGGGGIQTKLKMLSIESTAARGQASLFAGDGVFHANVTPGEDALTSLEVLPDGTRKNLANTGGVPPSGWRKRTAI